MPERRVWTIEDLRETYLSLYGPGEWTTTRILVGTEGLVSQAERVLRGYAAQDHRGERIELWESAGRTLYVRFLR